jgi:hypothetical protein
VRIFHLIAERHHSRFGIARLGLGLRPSGSRLAHGKRYSDKRCAAEIKVDTKQETKCPSSPRATCFCPSPRPGCGLQELRGRRLFPSPTAPSTPRGRASFQDLAYALAVTPGGRTERGDKKAVKRPSIEPSEPVGSNESS